jgi:transcriptional regulator with XRE-family HTH domain
MDVVEPLKYWRFRKGYSQSKLAKLAQVSALTIGHLESGKRKAREHTLNKILQGLGLSETEFFAMREGEPTPSLPAADATGEKPVEAGRTAPSTARETTQIKLSNLDLELLNRILNLDFEGKIEALKFLQSLR